MKLKRFPFCFQLFEMELFFDNFASLKMPPMIINAASWQDKEGRVNMILFYGN